ncbi:MAG: hypothetical protein V1913_08200, partial [Fibrobacterota bacterium]
QLKYNDVSKVSVSLNTGASMIFSNVMLIVLSCVFVIGLTGCKEPPTQDVENVEKMIAAAKLFNAQRYAPEQLEAAEDELSKALAEINNQKQKTFKNYDEATLLLRYALKAAEDAEKAALNNPDRVKAEINELTSIADKNVGEARKLVKKALQTVKEKYFIRRIKAQISALEMELKELKVAKENEKDPANLKTKARAIINDADALKAAIAGHGEGKKTAIRMENSKRGRR